WTRAFAAFMTSLLFSVFIECLHYEETVLVLFGDHRVGLCGDEFLVTRVVLPTTGGRDRVDVSAQRRGRCIPLARLADRAVVLVQIEGAGRHVTARDHDGRAVMRGPRFGASLVDAMFDERDLTDVRAHFCALLGRRFRQKRRPRSVVFG